MTKIYSCDLLVINMYVYYLI
ncbi:hypothetical protein Q558_01744, partial [Staphylococcus aureus M1503]